MVYLSFIQSISQYLLYPVCGTQPHAHWIPLKENLNNKKMGQKINSFL